MIVVYGMSNVALFDIFIFLFNLYSMLLYIFYIWIQSLFISIVYFRFCSIFDHLNSISVHFYSICFVSFLYSIIFIYIINDLRSIVFHSYSMTSIYVRFMRWGGLYGAYVVGGRWEELVSSCCDDMVGIRWVRLLWVIHSSPYTIPSPDTHHTTPPHPNQPNPNPTPQPNPSTQPQPFIITSTKFHPQTNPPHPTHSQSHTPTQLIYQPQPFTIAPTLIPPTLICPSHRKNSHQF